MRKLLLMLLIVALTSCNLLKEESKVGSNSGNISNGGLICSFDKGIIYRSESDDWKLYYYDGLEKIKICDDMASYINVVDSTVYYSNFSDGQRLYKINTDGSNRERLTNFSVSNVNVINKEIYFINMEDGFIVEKIDIKGDRTIIIDSKTNSLVTDGIFLYYIKPTGKDEFSIFMYNLKSYKTTQLTQSQYCHYINVIDRKVFYWSVNEDILRSIDIESLENTIILNQRVDHLNSSSKYLYFTNPKEGYNVFRCNLDGTDLIQISYISKDIQNYPSFNPSSIFLDKENVYYRGFSENVLADSFTVIDTDLNSIVFDFSSR